MNTEPQTVSITGVLKREHVPAWTPHDETATESEALDAIIKHMERDSLRIDLLCSSGPVHWNDVLQCWMAWGNFTIASGGFEVCPLSDAGRARLLEAWDAHRQSEHYQLAKRSAEIEETVRKTLDTKGWLYDSARRAEVWRPFLAEDKAIGKRLEDIYNGKAN